MTSRNVDIFGYSLGGSVSEMMNPVERRLPELTPAQIANLTASLAPGAASVDIAGEFPEFPSREMTTEEMLAGPRAPSLAENLAEGKYFSGIMQALGGLGDAATVIPAVGPLIGGILKTPRALQRLQRAKEAGFDTDTVYYHGADDNITEFRMPSRETGQTKTVGTGVFMTSSPEVAGSYAKTKNAVTYPVFIKKSEFVTVRPAKKGQFWNDISTDGLVAEFPDGTTKPASEVFDLDDSYTNTDELSRVARSKGFKGLIIEDVIDIGTGGAGEYRYASKYLQDRGYDVSLPIGTTKESYEKLEAVPDDILAAARSYAEEQLMRPADVVVSFDPKNIRSVNAKFEELDTAEILKASGGAVSKFAEGGIAELLESRSRFEAPLDRLTQPISADLGPLQMAIPQEEGLRQRAERVLAGLMGDEREDFRRAERALMAADVLPVLGDVGAAADVRDALSQDDVLKAGIAAISFLQVVGGMASKAFRGSADSIGPKSLDRQRGSIGVESEEGIPSLLEIEEFDPRFDPRVKEQDKLLGTTARILKKDNVADKPTLGLSELEGRGFVTTMSDRTAAGGRVMAINEVPLYRMVDLRGGQDFMFENPNKVWASAKKPAREILEAAQVVKKETGKDALYIPWRMAPTGGDFSTITGELMLGYASANMGKGAKRSLNSKLRKIIPDWDSVDNPDSVALWRATPDSKRKEAMNMMDVSFRDKGGLSIGAARLINTDPIQRTARDAGIQNVGRIFSDQPISKSDHPAYPFAVAGEGMGVLRRADEATIFDLLPEARLGEAQVPVKDPSKPTTEEKRALQMKAYSGTITENILRRMEERGVNINSFVGLAPGAIVFALTSSGVITPEEASAGGIQQFAEDVESVTDQKALSGIGSI